MNFFKHIFGVTPTNDPKKLPWIRLQDLVQLENIIEKSKTKPQLVFKHSTRCGISSRVKRQFENHYPLTSNEVDLYYLDLLAYRTLSNAIAEHFKVPHESPQLLVIKDGVVVAHASHGAINDLILPKLL